MNKKLAIIIILTTYFTFRNITSLDVGNDEGVHAYTAKTLAFKGRYALETSDGFLDFDRRIAIGPTVIIPTAIFYKLFGFGLVQTRAVVGLYFLLFIISFYMLVKNCFNQNIAFLASLLVLASLWPFWRELSLYTPINRILIGEAAALFFLSLGTIIYISGLQKERHSITLLGIFLIGTAVLTKLQFIISLIPTLAIFLIYLKGCSLKRYQKIISTFLLLVIYFLPILIWFLIQLKFFGPKKFFQVVSTYSAFERQFLYLSFGKFKQNIIDRWSELAPNTSRLFFSLPGLVYGWYYFMKNKLSKNYLVLYCLLFASLWLLWFPFSKGFMRYAIPGIFFTHIFLGLYFYERFKKRDIFAITLFSLLILYGFYINNRELKQNFEKDSQNMARYIEEDISDQATIETTELDYAVDLFFKYRKLKHTPAGIRDLIKTYKETHNPADDGVDYIITDPIDKTYEFTLTHFNWKEVTKFGSRVLFKLEE